jgi:ribose 5-phosphate isomerase B
MADKNMTIVVGSDHAGFPLKGEILEALKAAKHDVLDVGSYDDTPVDFPDIASQVTVRSSRSAQRVD